MSSSELPRLTKISQDEFDERFEGIFGKRVPTYLKKMIPDDVATDDLSAYNEERLVSKYDKENLKDDPEGKK